MLKVNPDPEPMEVKQILKESATDMAATVRGSPGPAYVNAYDAVEHALEAAAVASEQ